MQRKGGVHLILFYRGQFRCSIFVSKIQSVRAMHLFFKEKNGRACVILHVW
jgi:hypothetical protein